MDLKFPTWQLPYFDAVSEIPQGNLRERVDVARKPSSIFPIGASPRSSRPKRFDCDLVLGRAVDKSDGSPTKFEGI